MVYNKTKLALPFAGTWFVLNGGDTKRLNHHHGNKAQNHAFDFSRINDNDTTYKGDGTRNEDYFCFGESIVSPADGVVVEAVDGVRDNTPGAGNYLAGAGNYLLIRHSSHEYSFLAHLRKSSLSVTAGDKVRFGEELGECGNSGTSFAPHLHYHLQDSDTFVTYNARYEPADDTKGNFPTSISLSEEASGLKVLFSNITVDGMYQDQYSPKQGELVGNAKN